MINKLDHIAIAVKDLGKSLDLFFRLLGLSAEEKISVPSQGVDVVYIPAGSARIELITPTSSDSPVSKFLEKRGEGLHHICFTVKNIEVVLTELKSRGASLIDTVPCFGAEGRKIAFLHPKSTNGVLIELMEEKPD